jgi:polyvinyl alcohol dehydrogenase (cytochrome)
MRIPQMLSTTIFTGALLATVGTAPARADSTDWLNFGNGLNNTRYQADECSLTPRSVANLAVKWAVHLGGELSATPLVEDDALYMVDLGNEKTHAPGKVTRLDRDTGSIVWQRSVADITGIAGNLARVSPVVVGNLLVLGDQGGRLGKGARMFALDKHTGNVVWMRQVDAHPAAVITQSATAYRGTVYVGVASVEESYAVSADGYQCCSFRGKMVALDARTGDLRWETPMIDDAAYKHGYRGNAIWGSSPSIDPRRKLLYVSTGNNYDVPEDVAACVQKVVSEDPNNEARVRACLGSEKNFFDAIVALDLETGAIRWGRSMLPYDGFTIACVFMPEVFGANCPSPAGPDHDFGQAPMLFQGKRARKAVDLVGAGQKSGKFWALDRDTGAVVWSTKVGPGGHIGGAMWGSATDGERLYVTESNSAHVSWVLGGKGKHAGKTVNGGYWSALDPSSGTILWQTPDSNVYPADIISTLGPSATVMGAVSVAKGVVYGGSLAPLPNQTSMYALDARSGDVLWSFASGASVLGGAAISDGQVFWGSGYTGSFLNVGSFGDTLYAFEAP